MTLPRCLFMLLLGVSLLFAGEFVPRTDYSARLEPLGVVIHGAGQSTDAFKNYCDVMLARQKPVVYMFYIGLRDINVGWEKNLKSELMSYLPDFLIPQIGLYMTQDGTPSAHYEGDVAAGLMDAQINSFIDGLRSLARPVYLRIGYEFNGIVWNGYQPDTYKQAFIRITQKIREADLEVATVWDAAVGGDKNYMPFYPGDDVVDWWGINPFSVEDLSHATMLSFLNDAEQHHKPVMIGESTPRYVGVLQGETSWNAWFKPYFELIHAHPGLKMFCYINYNWADFQQWLDWGDCRLEKNAVVAGHYNDELKGTQYLHASGESAFRSRLSYNDTAAPSAVQNLAAAGSPPTRLTWNVVTDPSGLSHYILYDQVGIAGYSLNPNFLIESLFAGETANYRVTAMDRAGNEGQPSATVTVQMPYEMQKLQNGDFENDLTNWNTDVWGGAAVFDVEQASPISGARSAHVKITQSSGTAWHIQLRQWLRIKKGYKYTISYQARASKNVTISTWLQADHGSYVGYSSNWVSLTSQAKTFTHQALAGADDTIFLEFMMGDIGTADVWFDNVSVLEGNPDYRIDNVTLRVTVPKATPSADILYVAGSMNTWDPGPGETETNYDLPMRKIGSNRWELTLTCPAGQKLEYKYTRGAWAKVEKGSQGEEISNRILLVPQTDIVQLDTVKNWSDIPSGIVDNAGDSSPKEFELQQNYPNPFNSATTISFTLPVKAEVSLQVFDALGKKVATLVAEELPAGLHRVSWNADLPSGIYFYRLQAGKFADTKKLMLIR